MIRPLRQLHRFSWPIIAIGCFSILAVAIQSAPANRSDENAPQASNAEGDTVVIGNASFVLSLDQQGSNSILIAQPALSNRATTGKVSVTISDGTMQLFVTSLSTLRRGYNLPANLALPLTLSFDSIDQPSQTIVIGSQQL